MPNANIPKLIKIEQGEGGEFQKEGETTTIIVPSSVDTSNPSETISIITSNAEAAALGLVSIGTFEPSNDANGLETQEIIVENIDLDALQQHFVITSSPSQVCKLR